MAAQFGDLLRIHVAQRVFQAANGPRVELRDARFVHADLGANLLHGRFAVIVQADHFPFTRRQRLNRGADVVPHLGLLVGGVRGVRL